MVTDLKNKIVDIWIWTLVWVISSVIATTIMWVLIYSQLEKRVSFLEIKQEEIIESKANKEDIKIIEIKLWNIEKSLNEIKDDLKNLK